MKNAIAIFITTIIFSTTTQAKVYDVWPRIPFNIVGANLCEYRTAYSQTRSQYMSEMVEMAERLLFAGDFFPAETLMTFNKMYEANLEYAKKGLGVTLEQSFKAYLEQYYTKLRPKVRKLAFRYVKPIDLIINEAIRGRTHAHITRDEAAKIDLFAYGSYSMSPRCNGNIQVSLTLIGRSGYSKDYIATGPVSTVMSKIASQIFEDFQRTTFPTKLKIGNQYTLELLGGLNGDIDKVSYLEEAKSICSILGGRLPNGFEYKIINSYGSWSGGISLKRKIWAMDYPMVFIPYFTRSPVRNFSQVNEREYYYICVK